MIYVTMSVGKRQYEILDNRDEMEMLEWKNGLKFTHINTSYCSNDSKKKNPNDVLINSPLLPLILNNLHIFI